MKKYVLTGLTVMCLMYASSSLEAANFRIVNAATSVIGTGAQVRVLGGGGTSVNVTLSGVNSAGQRVSQNLVVSFGEQRVIKGYFACINGISVNGRNLVLHPDRICKDASIALTMLPNSSEIIAHVGR